MLCTCRHYHVTVILCSYISPWDINIQYLFIYLGFYVAFSTVQVISRRVVGRAEETVQTVH